VSSVLVAGVSSSTYLASIFEPTLANCAWTILLRNGKAGSAGYMYVP
jgi:hypothetical protein